MTVKIVFQLYHNKSIIQPGMTQLTIALIYLIRLSLAADPNSTLTSVSSVGMDDAKLYTQKLDIVYYANIYTQKFELELKTLSIQENSPKGTSAQVDDALPVAVSVGFLVCNSFLCISCVVLSGLIISFYKSKIKAIVPFVYFINASTDILIGSGVALQSFILIPQIGSNKEIAGYLSAVSYVIVGVSIRVSTFVNLLLCITRAINILYPFYRVSRCRVSCSIAVWVVTWLALSVWDVVWFNNNIGLESGLYVIKSLVFKPEMGFAALKAVTDSSFSNFQDLMILFVPAFILPVILLIASTVFQVIKLR